MIPVDQDEFYVDGTSRGNCYAAAIASIIERPLSDLREFHRLYLGYWDGARVGRHDFAARDAFFAELHRLGWHPVHFAAPGTPQFCESYGAVPRGYAIANGPAVRGVRHSVVVLDGRLAHDPHPSRAGLIEVESFEVLIPCL